MQRGGHALLGRLPQPRPSEQRQDHADDPQHGQHRRVQGGGVHGDWGPGKRVQHAGTRHGRADHRAQPGAAVPHEGRHRVRQLRHHGIPDVRARGAQRQRGFLG